MKRYISLMISMLLLYGCAKDEIKKDVVTKNDVIKNKEIVLPEKKKETIPEKEKINVGWSDANTYTVTVISENAEKAKDKARHKILQDIVKIRMLNESRFTDITKINAEFDKPLKNGRIISEKKADSGVEIYFQIQDEGLKQKFEKK